MIKARHNDDKFRYSEAKEFCELNNETLPRTSFRVIEKGHEQDSLFFVISGMLHAIGKKNGRDVLLGRISPGETIGEINMFDPAKASATVKSVEFSQVWRIDREALENFMNDLPLPAAHLLIGIATNLSRRLRTTNERYMLQN